MFSKAKYIVIDGMSPIVFDETRSHAEVKRALAPHRECTGAGFCHINDTGAYVCYGESTTLRIRSSPNDSTILNYNLGGLVDDA